jgi:hypothetical protein
LDAFSVHRSINANFSTGPLFKRAQIRSRAMGAVDRGERRKLPKFLAR